MEATNEVLAHGANFFILFIVTFWPSKVQVLLHKYVGDLSICLFMHKQTFRARRWACHPGLSMVVESKGRNDEW